MNTIPQFDALGNTERTTTHTQLYGHPFMVNGRPSGFLVDQGDHSELWRKDKDHLRKYPGPGICFDLGALAEAERLNVSIVRIKFPETNTEYITHIKAVREHGREFDYGYGRQICLQFKYWTKIDADGTVTPPALPRQAPQPKSEPTVDQPTLFDMPTGQRKGGY